MTDEVKPSPGALAAADAICKRHGMLPGGYMRDSLAEALEAFAAKYKTPLRGLRDALDQFYEVLVVDTGEPDPHRFALGDRDAIFQFYLGPLETAQHAADSVLDFPSVAAMLGQPITEAERDAISKDGP